MSDDDERQVEEDQEREEEGLSVSDLKQLREPWQRVRWARRRKYPTARAAAESIGMNEATYSAYERSPDSSKHIPLGHQNAVRFGRAFKVRWEWLLTGEDSPHPPSKQGSADKEATALSLKIVKLPQEDREHVVSLIERLSRGR